MARSASLRALAVALCSITIFATVGLAQSAPPVADSYALKHQPKFNFGDDSILAVQSGANSYLQFDLEALPPGAVVSKATLRLYIDAVVADGSFDVYQLNASWDEHTLNFNNAPGLGGSATGGHPVMVKAASMNQFVLIDVTPLVQAWVSNSEPNYGLALSLQGSKGAFSFDSKESIATSHQPELEIVLSGPLGPAGPTGATGAAGPMGPQGATGATGPQGIAGAQGLPGTPGATGQTGAVGQAGPIGQTGPMGPIGATGATGATGLIGPMGPAGAAGAAGTNGVDGKSFNFRNAFDPSAPTYAVNDVVTFSGSSYVAILASQGPDNPTPDQNAAAWSLMAQGSAGPAGPAGVPGLPGAPGPAGPQGDPGPSGPIGPTGPAGPGSTVAMSVIPFSPTPVFDATQGSAMKLTLTGDVTSSTFTGATAGQTVSLVVCQDSTGGHAFAPPANLQWSAVTTNTANYCIAEAFLFDGTTGYYLGPVAYTLGGAVTNLTSAGLAVQFNGGAAVPIPTGATSYTFPSTLYTGQTYVASVAQQPASPPETCTLNNPAGRVATANISNMALNCVSAPGAPTQVSAVAVSFGAASISWVPPTQNGGAPVTSYTVTASPGGASTTVSGTATSAQINGLVNTSDLIAFENSPTFIPPSITTSYTFTVTARNSFGNGGASVASNTLGPPGPPTNVVFTFLFCLSSTDPSCIYNYRWAPPAFNGGSPVLYYVVFDSKWGLIPADPSTSYSYNFTERGNNRSNGGFPSPIFAVNAFGEVSSPAF